MGHEISPSDFTPAWQTVGKKDRCSHCDKPLLCKLSFLKSQAEHFSNCHLTVDLWRELKLGMNSSGLHFLRWSVKRGKTCFPLYCYTSHQKIYCPVGNQKECTLCSLHFSELKMASILYIQSIVAGVLRAKDRNMSWWLRIHTYTSFFITMMLKKEHFTSEKMCSSFQGTLFCFCYSVGRFLIWPL